MSESNIQTTILLGNFKDKMELINKNIPQTDREKIIEEMLSYEDLYYRDETKVATIDILKKAYNKYKGSRINYRKFLNLVLNNLFKIKSGDNLIFAVENPTCNKEDLELVASFIEDNLRNKENFKDSFDYRILGVLVKKHFSIFGKRFITYFSEQIEKCRNLSDLEELIRNTDKIFQSETLDKAYSKQINDSIQVSLKGLNTKELISAIQQYERRSYWDEDSYYPQSIKISNFYNNIKEILKTREHIPNKSQSKLIRQMSIHAGKRLSLKEAQLLNNNLKRKKVKK